MRALIKPLLPTPAYTFLQGRRKRRRERRKQDSEQRYFEQSLVQIKCGAYVIQAPQTHLLVKALQSQPYRDLCVGITAKYISAKYPDRSIIDIGANIGDTAAIISTYSQNKLILIEASDYYFDILVRNTSQFPNEVVAKKCLILDGSHISGSFTHRGGTAWCREGIESQLRIKTERLTDVVDEDACYLKTDTDGYDFQILIDNLKWLAKVRPAILFENQIRSTRDLINSNDLYTRLTQIGYGYFMVWDELGFHLTSTTSLDVLIGLNRYLYKVWQSKNGGPKSVYNYDVLCLHESDADVYKNISDWYRNY